MGQGYVARIGVLPRLPWFGPELDCRLHRNSILQVSVGNCQENTYKCMAEERRFELLCPEGAAVFETAGLPIAHLLRSGLPGGSRTRQSDFADRPLAD